LKGRGRIALQVAVSGGILAFLLFQLDLGRTVELVRSSNIPDLAAAVVLIAITTAIFAWRWQILLASKGIDEGLGWLTKLYFIGYAVGQVLPSSMGSDAVRIVEHARRRPTAKAEVAGAVLMERILGASAVLLLVAVALAIAAGRYEDLELVVWVEAASIAAMVVLAVVIFSRRTRRLFEDWLFPFARRIRLERVLESVHRALHGYRERPGTLGIALAATLAGHVVRIAAIWLCGEAVGLDLSPLVYVIFGPILFLVMLVPFTINAVGVREAAFVAFLGRFDVDASAAFATGFLFYVVTVAASIPGALILLWRSVRPALVRAHPG
jgi:glycosyltransferase 2 family protein